MIEEQKSVPDDPPPILERWPRVYALVLIYLAMVIAIFFYITKRLAP
jgi:hypothetical protein